MPTRGKNLIYDSTKEMNDDKQRHSLRPNYFYYLHKLTCSSISLTTYAYTFYLDNLIVWHTIFALNASQTLNAAYRQRFVEIHKPVHISPK